MEDIRSHDGYDANKSQVSDERLATFLAEEMQEDITSVPGIGPSTAEKLKQEEVHTTYQLLGQILKLKGNGMDADVHADEIWMWLKESGVNAHRSGIVRCFLEKLEILIPNIYFKECENNIS